MADSRTFNLSLDAFARKIHLTPTLVTKQVAFDLFTRIVKRTPVDTGRARASWTIAVNGADRRVAPPAPEGTTERYYPDPPVGKLDLKPGDFIVISNNLPYIVSLEDGHSRRSPAGMVKVSIAEIEANMAARLGALGGDQT